MITIAVDAMGSDFAPRSEIEGAIQATRALPLRVLLVGREDILRQELARFPEASDLPIDIIHASQHVTMEDSITVALRIKKDSSIRVAANLVRDGIADGWVSAGNTGAVMAVAKLVQGLVPGVNRPALASAFPTLAGTPSILIDVGANVDCTPAMLAQFAIMGDAYSRVIFHLERPRIGLLSIGEEEIKGNDLTRSALALLKTLPLNFIGNVEGRDIYSGRADVIVCDGFVGNVALKVSEGLAEIVKQVLQETLTANLGRKFGFLLLKGALAEFKRRMDYSEYGGAPLLGVQGVCIICHGRSNGNAIKNAIRVAYEFVVNQINRRIEMELKNWMESLHAMGMTTNEHKPSG